MAIKPAIILAALIMGAVASPAEADWQYTRWGMTPGQVVAASHGSVRPGQAADALVGTYEAGSLSYSANFGFVGGRLAEVKLSLSGVEACREMILGLSNVHGAPIRQHFEPKGYGVAEWLDNTGKNDILLAYWIQTCSVSYGPLPTAASTGL